MKCLKVFFFCVFAIGSSVIVFADDDQPADSAENKAKEIHRLASSDVIYQDQETKAIYYQNVQIIDLLKQIRDILDTRLKEDKTEANPTPTS